MRRWLVLVGNRARRQRGDGEKRGTAISSECLGGVSNYLMTGRSYAS